MFVCYDDMTFEHFFHDFKSEYMPALGLQLLVAVAVVVVVAIFLLFGWDLVHV